MAILNWFGRDEVIGSRVLVCALDPRFDDLLKADSQIYSKFYTFTDLKICSNIQQLNHLMNQSFDLIHLFAEVSSEGLVISSNGECITGTQLIAACCGANVKVLWLANDNEPEGYVKGFNVRKKRINLVMTIHRNGSKFPDFLEKLLSRMAYGDTMPVAWADLAPQVRRGLAHKDLPDCIFYAGRGGRDTALIADFLVLAQRQDMVIARLRITRCANRASIHCTSLALQSFRCRGRPS